MKSQKYIIIITSSVSVIALVLAVLYHYSGKEFETNLLIGLFSSSFLAMLISIIEYSNKRRETMEQFYASALKALHVINQYRNDLELNKAIDKVLAIFNYDYSEFNTAYGAMSFLFSDKRTRKYIYQNIYEPILKLRNDMTEICYHLSLYKDGISKNGKVAKKMIDKASSLLMDIEEFDDEISEDEVVHCTYVSNKFYSPIEKELNGHYWNIMYLNRKR